jgi:hypothetical protein
LAEVPVGVALDVEDVVVDVSVAVGMAMAVEASAMMARSVNFMSRRWEGERM